MQLLIKHVDALNLEQFSILVDYTKLADDLCNPTVGLVGRILDDVFGKDRLMTGQFDTKFEYMNQPGVVNVNAKTINEDLNIYEIVTESDHALLIATPVTPELLYVSAEIKIDAGGNRVSKRVHDIVMDMATAWGRHYRETIDTYNLDEWNMGFYSNLFINVKVVSETERLTKDLLRTIITQGGLS